MVVTAATVVVVVVGRGGVGDGLTADGADGAGAADGDGVAVAKGERVVGLRLGGVGDEHPGQGHRRQQWGGRARVLCRA